MRKKTKKTDGGDMDVRDLAWKNFVETGEIGAYMFYKKVSEDDNGRENDSGDCSESD